MRWQRCRVGCIQATAREGSSGVLPGLPRLSRLQELQNGDERREPRFVLLLSPSSPVTLVCFERAKPPLSMHAIWAECGTLTSLKRCAPWLAQSPQWAQTTAEE